VPFLHFRACSQFISTPKILEAFRQDRELLLRRIFPSAIARSSVIFSFYQFLKLKSLWHRISSPLGPCYFFFCVRLLGQVSLTRSFTLLLSILLQNLSELPLVCFWISPNHSTNRRNRLPLLPRVTNPLNSLQTCPECFNVSLPWYLALPCESS